jgi:metal-responsive CopG/Arc/MetJ family transcriptional regulator
MSVVNFSIPDDVLEAFEERFKGQNKSAIVADLMRQAVEDMERRKRIAKALRELREMRDSNPPGEKDAVAKARKAMRR